MSFIVRSLAVCAVACSSHVYAAEGDATGPATYEPVVVSSATIVVDASDPSAPVIVSSNTNSDIAVSIAGQVAQLTGDKASLPPAFTNNMQKMVQEQLMPAMRDRMEKEREKSYAALGQELHLSDEEYSAVKPLIVRVESLRSQRAMVERRYARIGDQRFFLSGRPTFEQTKLYDSEDLEPSITHMQDAMKTLDALLKDGQANEAEIDSALNQLRKARQTYDTILGNARAELRSVLTREQEARLVMRGILE